MSIVAYSGLPGSGKSYGVFENVIIPALRDGIPVFTNIPFNESVLFNRYGACPIAFETKDIQDNDNWFSEVFQPGAIFVLDEAWRLWRSGTRANQMNPNHSEFLAEHRHQVGQNGRSTQIVLVTQDLNQLASFPRSLVETTYRAVKLTAVGAQNSYRIDIYAGAVTGQNPPKSAQIRQMYGKYNKDIYECYQSHTKSETGSAGDESKVDKRANVLKGFIFKFYPALFVIGVIFIIWAGGNFWSYYKTGGSNESLATPIPDSQNSATTTPGTEKAPAKPKKSDFLSAWDYRIDYNNGFDLARTNWSFRLTDGDAQITVTRNDLLAMGYEFEAINKCLVVASRDSFKHLITCKKDRPTNGSLIDFNWAPGQTTGDI